MKAVSMTCASLMGLANAYARNEYTRVYSFFQEYFRSVEIPQNGETNDHVVVDIILDKNEMWRKSQEKGVDLSFHIFFLPYLATILHFLVDFLFHFEQVVLVGVILMNELRKMCLSTSNKRRKE